MGCGYGYKPGWGGSGFITAPVISFSQSGSTTAASITANISGGSVTGFNILNGGAGYTSAPTVMFVSADYSTTHGIRHVTSGTATISNNHIGSITTVGSKPSPIVLKALLSVVRLHR
ncbi:MAG: hypothetical protein IPP72_16360 [Chitinophagaceae bacterium]|nr:hypothetical protein [Chitinophagaceae bacterium]